MNYPQSDQDWMNADWLEFKVLSSEFDVYSLDDFQSVLEELQDVESEDFCESDNDFQNKIEQIIREINLREQHLGSTYPFRFSDDGKSLILKHTLNEGCYVYLFCLIISHHNRREILLVDPPMNNTVRDLFQICATLAGAGKVNGSAISFGFPRPSTTPFLDALKEAYAKIGEGEVISKFRLGQSKYVKDSEIDIIAWQYQPVNLPGKYYVLGQAASGANW